MGINPRTRNEPSEASLPFTGSRRRGLILSGGGMRLSYQAGAIRALLESGLRFEHIDGTSGGSLNMSMLLSGQSPEQMCSRWRSLDLRDSVSFLPLKEYLDVEDLNALAGTSGMRDRVLPALGIDIDRIRSASGISGVYNVLNYTRKQVSTIEHRDIDADMLVAGMSLPGVMPPLEREGEVYLDAAFVKDANLLDAVYRGCEELWVIWGLGNTSAYQGGALNLYIQMLEMSANGALISELEQISEINERITRGETVHGHDHPVRIHIIKPDYPLPLDPDVYLGKIDSGMLIDMGYSDARKYLNSCQEEGIALDYRATQQSNPEPGVVFRLHFAGELNPEASSATNGGVQAAEPVSFKVGVRIHNLDRFIKAEKHQSPMFAHLSFPESGEDACGYEGQLEMFRGDSQPGLKSIEYGCRLVLRSHACYLHAEQRLKDDPGFDLIDDLRTLYVSLYRGNDDSGSVLWTGVLKLRLDHPSAMAANIHPMQAGSLVEAGELVAKFMRFYLGELFETYF